MSAEHWFGVQELLTLQLLCSASCPDTTNQNSHVTPDSGSGYPSNLHTTLPVVQVLLTSTNGYLIANHLFAAPLPVILF